MADPAKLKEAMSLVRQATAVLQECIEEYGGVAPEGGAKDDLSGGGYPVKAANPNRLGAMAALMGSKKGQ